MSGTGTYFDLHVHVCISHRFFFVFFFTGQKESESDQEISQSRTADQLMAPSGKAAQYIYSKKKSKRQ